MSWIKPNFLRMMYRSGWGTEKDQEVILAVSITKYSRDWIVDIEDISAFVREQYEFVKAGDLEKLTTPREPVYPVIDKNIVKKFGLSLARDCSDH